MEFYLVFAFSFCCFRFGCLFTTNYRKKMFPSPYRKDALPAKRSEIFYLGETALLNKTHVSSWKSCFSLKAKSRWKIVSRKSSRREKWDVPMGMLWKFGYGDVKNSMLFRINFKDCVNSWSSKRLSVYKEFRQIFVLLEENSMNGSGKQGFSEKLFMN